MIKKILFTILALLPSVALAQVQGEGLGLGMSSSPLLCRVNEALAELADTNGDANYCAVTKTGKLYVTSGTAATDLGKAEDTAHATGHTGVPAWAVANTTLTSFGANGDYSPISVTREGAVIATIDSDNQLDQETGLLKLESTNHVNFDAGVPNLGVRQDTLQADASDGNYQFFKSNSLGAAYVSGQQAHDAVVDSANYPHIKGGVAGNTNPTAVASGDVVRASFDRYGKQVIQPYCLPGSCLSAFLDPTDATSQSIIAAPAAGLAICLTSATAANYNAAADALELETSGSTILWATRNAANTPFGQTFPSPLCAPAATAVHVDAGNAGDWYVTVTYFLAPVS